MFDPIGSSLSPMDRMTRPGRAEMLRYFKGTLVLPNLNAVCTYCDAGCSCYPACFNS